ncbi:MAG: TldD/PmbA family protein [Rhodospirillales bacterium]
MNGLQDENADNALDRLSGLVRRARAAGADTADAVMVSGAAVSVSVRLGELEGLERSEGAELGLRVFIGKKQAIASSSDMSPQALEGVVERAVAMARAAPEDEFAGLAEPHELPPAAPETADTDSCDPTAPPADDALKTWALAAEDAARAVAGVTNSEGAEAGWSRRTVALAASNGFARARRGSSVSVGASVIAGEAPDNMVRDYDHHTSVYAADLEAPDAVGRSAGERAVRMLNPRKAPTGPVPVIFEPRAAAGLAGHFAAAVNGASVARGTSFLKDRMGEQVLAPGISIIDDPLRRRGLASRPFDAEGAACAVLALAEGGVLRHWLLDLRSARKLGLKTNARAGRGIGSPPSPGAANLHMAAGAVTPRTLMADIKAGLYVTGLIGMGVNLVTGDYSRGAEGFWIENGEITHPVNEITIAGNLKDMFMRMTPADDLTFRRTVNAPTVRVDGLTVAGV